MQMHGLAFKFATMLATLATAAATRPALMPQALRLLKQLHVV
jgi:hypothetical protein